MSSTTHYFLVNVMVEHLGRCGCSTTEKDLKLRSEAKWTELSSEKQEADFTKFIEVFTYGGEPCYRCRICGCGAWSHLSTVKEHFRILGLDEEEHRRKYLEFLNECNGYAEENTVCWSCGSPVSYKGARFCTECGERL